MFQLNIMNFIFSIMIIMTIILWMEMLSCATFLYHDRQSLNITIIMRLYIIYHNNPWYLSLYNHILMDIERHQPVKYFQHIAYWYTLIMRLYQQQKHWLIINTTGQMNILTSLNYGPQWLLGYLVNDNEYYMHKPICLFLQAILLLINT